MCWCQTLAQISYPDLVIVGVFSPFGQIPQLDPDFFPPWPFRFIIHIFSSIQHYTEHVVLTVLLIES